MFASHSNELNIPEPVSLDPNAVEIVRVWAAQGKQVVSLRPDVWEDPFAWGMFLVDLAKHVANAFEQMNKGEREAVLGRIKEGFEAEWDKPTDEAEGKVVD